MSYLTRAEVLRSLQAEGFKIGKSKLYLDCRAGRLRLQADGLIAEPDLAAYRESLRRPDLWGGTSDRRSILYEARRSLMKAVRLIDLVARQLGTAEPLRKGDDQ